MKRQAVPRWSWNPRHGGATQPLLQDLNQRHEVPDRKNMVLHERAKRQAAHACRGKLDELTGLPAGDEVPARSRSRVHASLFLSRGRPPNKRNPVEEASAELRWAFPNHDGNWPMPR